MKYLLPSSIEECIAHMGEPKVIIKIDDKSSVQIAELKQDIEGRAKLNGYGNIVLKTENGELYVF